jgi:hypothetical protein
MMKATFVNFFYRSYQVLLTVLYPGELYRLLGASSLVRKRQRRSQLSHLIGYIKGHLKLFSIFSLAAILVGSQDHRTHFWIIPQKFDCNWPSGFRGEDF